jgi:GNAT superfamily N-acetyltransferase
VPTVYQAGTYPIEIQPLVKSNWKQFEQLLGERGGCGGCWCMTHRLSAAAFEQNKYDGNKKLLSQLVEREIPVGLLGIMKQEAIAWLSFAPRSQFTRLEKSRIYKPVDFQPVWSITCFFIKKEYRNKGISLVMIEAAKTHAQKNNIKILEAYPVKPYADRMPDPFAWTGFFSTFEKAGFKVVSNLSKARPMMRYFTSEK